ncbi:MAG: NAD(P)/FAD-dependent oxidoreductase [Phycisphaeraceae bacterium]
MDPDVTHHELLFPLDAFYSEAGLPAPRCVRLDGPAMPEPYRSLLVHTQDMTPTLEAHHGGRISLKLFNKHIDEDGWFCRRVALVLDETGRHVEFGAIRIDLSQFSPEAQKHITECHRPLGTILNEDGIAHYGRPAGFFRVQSDPLINETLGLKETQELFGRRNILYSDKDQPLAEVVEILPPVAPKPAAKVNGNGQLADEALSLNDNSEHTSRDKREGESLMKPSRSADQQYDAIIIGGGPAGTTAAATLAMKGRRVILFEKEKFPRYHIGESLIPHTYWTLERIGMIPKMKASAFPKKYSVQFVRQDGKASVPFYFHTHMQHEAAQTWQVLRADFDQMLMENAREKGAVCIEQAAVKELIHDEAGTVIGVRVSQQGGPPQEYFAPITIDATGRDAFSIVREDWRERDPCLNKIAIWTYYKGAVRDPGLDEGATTVAYVQDKGWFWYIPLPDDVVSVGVVAEKDYLHRNGKDPEAIFKAEIEENLWIKEHVTPGTVIDRYRVTNEFSYRSRYCARDGLVLIGDAFGFLDPVFSSGVFLALRSGELAADAVDTALDAGDVSAGMFEEYGRQVKYGIESMRKLVYAFYDPDFSFAHVIRKYPHLRGDLTDCLIGDLFRDFTELFDAVKDFATTIPEPLAHGGPLVKGAVSGQPSVVS